MQQGHNKIKDKAAILITWLIAVSLLYIIFLKFKILLH